MRTAYGKGVAYTEINGKGVVFIATPGFFLVALDADTGKPLPNWGRPVGLPSFPQTGVVDLVEDLVRDWDPWTKKSRNTTRTRACRSISVTSRPPRRRLSSTTS